MNRLLRLLVLLPALMFIVTGLRWLVAPAGVAPQFGLELAVGLGLSSQVGDMSGFFITLGVCILLGLATERRIWFYPAILLLSITALGRTVAWLLHDAALARFILVELVVSVLLWVASRRLPTRG